MSPNLRRWLVRLVAVLCVAAGAAVAIALQYRLDGTSLERRETRYVLASQRLIFDVRASTFAEPDVPAAFTLARRSSVYATLALREEGLIRVIRSVGRPVALVEFAVLRADSNDPQPTAEAFLTGEDARAGLVITYGPSVPVAVVAARAFDAATASALAEAATDELQSIVDGPTSTIEPDEDVVVRRIGSPLVSRVTRRPPNRP